MRLRRRLCTGAGILMALTTFASTPTRAQTGPVERISGEDGRYSVEMPAGYTSKTAPRPDGGTMRTISYLWKGPSEQYDEIALAVIDPPPGSTKQADLWEFQRLVRARYPGLPSANAQEIRLGPAEGLSFAFTVNSNRNQGQHTIAFRVYALGGRLYEMMAVTKADDRDNPVVVAFMNSLRINR